MASKTEKTPQKEEMLEKDGIASPRDERDPGIVAEGRFAVDGKTLYVKDQQGEGVLTRD
jgi:hypothetical protein